MANFFFVWKQVDVIVLLHLLSTKGIDAFKCQLQIDRTRHSFRLQRVVHICWINKCLEDNTESDVRPLSYCFALLVKKRLYQLIARGNIPHCVSIIRSCPFSDC